MQIPLGQYAYRRADLLTPAVRLENVYAEQAPTNLKTGVDLLTRPSLDLLTTAGAGPVRAVFWEEDVFADDALVVSGTELFRVTQAGAASPIGTVPGTGAVEIACSPTEALIANGAALLVTDGMTVTAKAFPDDLPIASVGYLNGYFLAVPVDSHRIYYTDLLTGEFDATRFVSAERYPDIVLKLVITSDEVWTMGPASVEVFVPTGVDTDDNPPFQRVEGRLYKKGVLSARTVVEADNTVFWVGQSKDAGLVVYRGGDVPQVVSNPSISERLLRAAPATMTAWAFGIAGHSFYVLGLGTEGTWVYDISMAQNPGLAWQEWTSYARNQWRAHLGRGCWPGVVLAGDDQTGDLWTLNETGTTDNGQPIVQVFTAGTPVEGRPSNPSLSLDCAVGQGEGRIRLRFSDDQGRTWAQHDDQRLYLAQYAQRVRWNRLGSMQAPARVYEWTISDPVRMRVSSARINDPL